ncbi:unnamed protein product [marine sediment metagenome]|uniref:Uncharacterized protein n=1 Tax=marine sediment metagenome TaxID=412755 RepID=X1BMS2_9ZZZZ
MIKKQIWNITKEWLDVIDQYETPEEFKKWAFEERVIEAARNNQLRVMSEQERSKNTVQEYMENQPQE